MPITPQPGECYHVHSIRATVIRANPDGRHVWVKVGSGATVKVPIATLVPITNTRPEESRD